MSPAQTLTGGQLDLTSYPWFYLRQHRPLTPGEELVELLLVGDLSFGRETDNGCQSVPPDALRSVAPLLRQADLVMGNLESPLVPDGTSAVSLRGGHLLRGKPQDAFALAAAGFDLVGVANNHAGDYGAAMLAASNARIRQLGLVPVGREPVWREVRGVRFAFLAFNQILAAAPNAPRPPTVDEMLTAVAIAHARADVVVVSVHWGYEYELRPDPAQQRLAAALRAAGADIIAGHHPHVAQPVALLDRGVVAYSLGNFLFDQGNAEMSQGLILRVLLDRQGIRAVQGLPTRAGVRPSLLAPVDAQELLARISPPPQRIGYTMDEDGLRPIVVSQEPATGRFWSGQVDLTGDGKPERVRLEGTRVRIYQDGQPLWETPAAWEVVDAALGDPNDDGRQELMLAVWKDDPAGFRRSHPYLVGYRGGAYSLIWGGRAVAEPIQEIELGDVDGDGRQELLALLEGEGGRRIVAVWRWHGWGFSLGSRSSPGAYRDLVLRSGLAGMPPVISVALFPE